MFIFISFTEIKFNMKKILLLSYTACLLVFAGCSKEDDSKGCTDQKASNYNADAVENCCCEYKGDVIFYFNQTTSNKLKQQASNSLDFYVDKKKVGTFSSGKYYNAQPYCNTPETITISKNWTDGQSKTYEYMVTDEVGKQIWKGNQQWNAGTCTPVELKY